MTTTKKAIGMLCALAAGGCAAEPVATRGTDNTEVSVDTLFTHEGCTVYRFEDSGRQHYFVKCAPPVQPATAITTQTEYQPAGKTTTSRPENVETR